MIRRFQPTAGVFGCDALYVEFPDGHDAAGVLVWRDGARLPHPRLTFLRAQFYVLTGLWRELPRDGEA